MNTVAASMLSKSVARAKPAVLSTSAALSQSSTNNANTSRQLPAVAGSKLLTLLLLGSISVLSTHIAHAQDSTGSTLYSSACATCHGANALGAQQGPSLVPRVRRDDDATLLNFIRTGSPERGMPPAAVPAEQLPALLSYVRQLVNAAPATSAPVSSNTITTNRSIASYSAIDDAMLENPSANDWLSFSRTLDAQRFSPLNQITQSNVKQLSLAWSRGLANGMYYGIPLVHDGVMYLSTPDAGVIALDATNGDLIWEYKRNYANPAQARQNRSKTIALYADLVYFNAPDATIVAIDARTGVQRWEASTGHRGASGGLIAANGKVVSSGNCVAGPRDACNISAHDALSGKLLWQFNTIAEHDPKTGEDTWAGVPLEKRLASPWGLPGSYDPKTNLIYWGIANPMPTTRTERHGADYRSLGTGFSAPTDLYSNSTVAIHADTGKLAWYYQHLPGDDWDLDMNEERTLLQTTFNPDPQHVRWINPNIERGSVREVSVNVGEGGGLWVLDRKTGEFLWATPFPFNRPNFFLSDIDVTTGQTFVNQQVLVDEPGERQVVCYFNTRSFWPTAYSPQRNSLYVPYIRNCLDMTSANPAANTPEKRIGSPEPGVPENELNGLAKVNLSTGEITHWPMGRMPTTSAILATAGDVIFWGDLNRRYRAMAADTGEVLWETVLGGPISMSNISYAVNGKQYIAVVAGETSAAQTVTSGGLGPININLGPRTGAATVYVFALPQ